jgi:hypothetical protein
VVAGRRDADAVDAVVDAVEASRSDAAVDVACAEAGEEEVGVGDLAVLPRGTAGDEEVRVRR